MTKTALFTLEFTDNRLAGLLREIGEAIEDCDDPVTLRRLGVSLQALGSQARGRGWEINPKRGSRSW